MLAIPGHLSLDRAVPFLAFLLASLAPAAAQDSIRLNGPLSTEIGGGVVEGRISPDGSWIVYLATQDSGVPGLFSAPIDGSAPSRRLVSADVASVPSWEVSARDELVYTDWRRLFVVPLDGSRAPLPLTREEDGLIHSDFQVSANGAFVVYFTLTDNGDLSALNSIGTDGRSTPVRLNGPGIMGFTLDPRGEQVAFFNSGAVFVMPIDGSGERKRLNPGSDWIPHYRPLVFSPEGDRLLYCSRQGSNSDELWSAPTDASQPAVKLNGPLQPTGDVIDYVISSDGTRVLYRADQDSPVLELYGVPIDGSQPAVRVNETTRGIYDYAFDVDSLNAVYLSDEQDGELREPELYHAPIDASAAPHELLPAIFDAGWSYDPTFEIALASRRVVYRAKQGGVVDLYSVPLGHGETIQLTHTSDPEGGPWSREVLTPDGRTVVYLERVAPFDDVWLELRAVPVDGSSDPLGLGGPFHLRTGGIPSPSPQIASDGKHVLLRIGLEIAGVTELYSAPVDGHRAFAPVHPSLVTEEIVDDVKSLLISEDGSQAIFDVRSFNDEPFPDPRSELYSVPLQRPALPTLLHVTAGSNTIVRYAIAGGNVVFLERIGDSEPDYALRGVPADGSGPAVTLSPQGDGTKIPFHLTPDGSRAVFTLYGYETTGGTIHAVPATGGPAIDLSGAPVAGGKVRNSRLSPDARVVYAADALVAGVVELFSVPVDGSAPPVRLNAPFVAGGNVLTAFSFTEASGYAISPEGSTVVYLADQEQNERFELYRVPIDGSAAPVKLNGALVSGGDVLPSFRISDDGQWIVYVADQLTNNRNELFAGPLDGSSVPVRISAPLVLAGNVQEDFQLDPIRPRVVYRADQLVNETFELFSVALDGSEPALRLNGPLGPEGDVSTGFVVGPDGTRVLFRANADERFELYGATLGVAHGAVKLSGDLAAGRTVLEGLRFSSNGALALFAADLDVDERFELWAVPSAGGGKPQRIHDPFVPGGDVVRPGSLPWEYEPPVFEPAPGRASVVYIADQDADEAMELYLGRLTPPRTAPVLGPILRRGR